MAKITAHNWKIETILTWLYSSFTTSLVNYSYIDTYNLK